MVDLHCKWSPPIHLGGHRFKLVQGLDTLGFKSKEWKNEVVVMCLRFPVKCSNPNSRKYFYFEKPLVKLEYNLKSMNQVHYGVFWTPSFLDPDANVNLPWESHH